VSYTGERVYETDFDRWVARARPIPREKKLGEHYPPCPHCGLPGIHLVYHCADKQACTWLRCPTVVGGCAAIVEPSDWSHIHTEHGRTMLRRCS
jgi:hypothetical protein